MTLTLSEEVERALKAKAAQLGKTPDELANETLRQLLITTPQAAEAPPRDDWERRLLTIGRPAGVTLTNEQLSRESLYED